MIAKRPFFSIIIPTYNAEKVIERCLCSIISQLFQSYEVIIVDGNSTDNTISISKESFNGEKIKLFSQKDEGTYDAMNKGIELSTGEWIYFLGSDDELYDNNVLSSIAKAANQIDANVIYGNALIVNDSTWAKNGEVYDGEFDFSKLARKNICHQAIFYKRSFLNAFNLRYNLAYTLLADWDFNFQCFAKTKFHYTNTIISKFFSGGQTTINNQDLHFYRDVLKNITTYFKLSPFDKAIDLLPGYHNPAINDLRKKQSVLKYYFLKVKKKLTEESKIKSGLRQILTKFRYPHNSGYCTICETDSVFVEFDKWLRDNYRCIKCGSIPRNRALVRALNVFYPEWKKLSVHESSPGGPLSNFLKRSCEKYSASHYYENIPRGNYFNGFRSEDLTKMTFDDGTFDVFITSDVFEHVFEPELAFKEIARILKPGGAHIFTMPWYPAIKKSIQRAKLENGKIIHLKDPEYHGNPISDEGSLVTFDWGSDFCSFIYESAGTPTTVYLEKNKQLGLEADLLEVFISKKD